MAGLVEHLLQQIESCFHPRGKQGSSQDVNLGLDWGRFFEDPCWMELKAEWKRMEEIALDKVLLGKGEERDKFSGAALAYRDILLIEEEILQKQEEYLKRREKEMKDGRTE